MALTRFPLDPSTQSVTCKCFAWYVHTSASEVSVDICISQNTSACHVLQVICYTVGNGNAVVLIYIAMYALDCNNLLPKVSGKIFQNCGP